MNETTQNGEPRVIGFESKPIPTTNVLEFKKIAVMGVAIAFVGFLLFAPGSPSTASPAKDGPKYVAPWKKNKATKSTHQTLQEVQANIDRQMKKNQQLINSINQPR